MTGKVVLAFRILIIIAAITQVSAFQLLIYGGTKYGGRANSLSYHFSRNRSKKSNRFSERSFSGLHANHPTPFDNSKADDILLCINFSMKKDLISTISATSTSVVDIFLEELRAYVRSFPYAAILPVQPMEYLPSESGVKLTFLRKKTSEKGMRDGGIQIDVINTSSEVDEDDELSGEAPSTNTVQLIVLRMSDGQTVSKIFSEKIVSLKLLDGIRLWVTKIEEQQQQSTIQLTSIYHKWMDVITS